MHRLLKVTFHLDGTGVHYDAAEPIHLDSLLAFCCAAHGDYGRRELTRDSTPDDIPIPCAKWRCGDVWGWRASALFPDGDLIASVQYWRKRFRVNRVHLSSGSPNLTNATFRDWNMPLPLTLCHRMVGWCVGERRDIRHELIRGVRHMGKKAAHGHGHVNDVTVEEVSEDWSLVREGKAQRWLPMPDAPRLCRPRPPYWNRVGRVNTCEVGQEYDIKDLSI